MRAIALAGAALHVLLCTVAGYAMWFFATFPFENQSSEQAEADDWLLAAAGLILLLALAFAGTVVGRWRAVAAVVVAGELAVGLAVLIYSLQASDHSDGRLLLYALAVWLTASVAVTATWLEQRAAPILT
jgi:hypothetical protein